MQIWTRLKAAKGRLGAGALVALVAGYVSVQFITSGETPPFLTLHQQVPAPTPAPATVAAPQRKSLGTPSGAPGMRVYIEPKTGQFQKPPAGEIPGEEELFDSAVTEPSGARSGASKLQELPSSMAGGGVVTNVRLRFRRPLVAVRDAEGKLTIQHAPQEADLTGEQ